MASNIQAVKTMRPAIVSLTQQQAHKRCFKLYRNCLRAVPYLIQHYNLSYDISEMRHRIRVNFEQFGDVKEISQLDRLSFIGETEIFEAMSLLKTRSHIVNYFDTTISKPKEEEDETKQLFDQLLQ